MIARSEIKGPINATAPIPVTNNKLTEELARRLHRPALFRVPDALVRRINERHQRRLGAIQSRFRTAAKSQPP